jgi:hypothetical protein
MRRAVLIAALLATTAGLAFTVPQSAHASTYLQCNDGFHQLRGKAGSNPPVSATVARQDDGRWSVVYVLSNGQTVMRENQYDIADKGNGVGWTGWRSGKQMRASIEHYNGRLIYAEAVYSGGDKLVGSNYIDCGPAPADEPDFTPPAYTAPVVASTPSYVATPASTPPAGLNSSPAPRAVVQLYDIPHVNDAFYVSVNIGGVDYHMTLDTGCSDLFISKPVADWLIANDQAEVIGSVKGKIADGSTSTARQLNVKSISLDGHTITNVTASDGAPDQNEGSMLLGLGVLKHFGKFSIDTAGHQLVLG